VLGEHDPQPKGNVRAAARGHGPGRSSSLHGSVWTSTDSTAGRSRTIGAQ
jgi:hypothetical protein